MSEIKALVHDVFGTVVDWRSAVTADGQALGARKGITGVDWQQFADEWRGAYAPSMNRVRTGELPWTNLDALHRLGLDALLKKFEITGLSEEDKVWFNLTWHRLKPWPDSVPGLTRLKTKYIIATLSNGTVRLLTDMAKHCGLPWDTVLGSDLVKHYKPDAEMYQSAIEYLGSGDPGAVMMVAAHNNDLVSRRQARDEDRLHRPPLRARRQAGARLQGRARLHLRRRGVRGSGEADGRVSGAK